MFHLPLDLSAWPALFLTCNGPCNRLSKWTDIARRQRHAETYFVLVSFDCGPHCDECRGVSFAPYRFQTRSSCQSTSFRGGLPIFRFPAPPGLVATNHVVIRTHRV